MFSLLTTPRSFHLLPAAALLLTLGSCMREGAEPKRVLPEATQSGLNTAGANVDGQVWLPATVLFAGDATQAVYQRVNGQYKLTISLRRVTDGKADALQQTTIYLSVPDIKVPGTVVFDQNVDPYTMVNQKAFASLSYRIPTERELVTNSGTPGRLIVTRLDTVARIVAGTFEFQAQERGTAATAQRDGGPLRPALLTWGASRTPPAPRRGTYVRPAHTTFSSWPMLLPGS